jgi:HD-GYP domain-containing protein (c-di-GMP phosphodiesterase class II)
MNVTSITPNVAPSAIEAVDTSWPTWMPSLSKAQPLIAVCATLTAALLVATVTIGTNLAAQVQTESTLILLCGAMVVAAEQFPIHVRLNTKVQMTTIPIFLMAALLQPGVAGIAAGCAMLVGEISVNKIKGNYPSDIATDVARWTIAGIIGSLIIHSGWHGIGTVGLLACAGTAMWLWDMGSSPATLSPMSGETPIAVIRASIQEAGPSEAAQYVLGVTAVILAQYNMWAIGLLLLPVAFVQIATKSSKELRQGTRDILERLADTVDLRDPYTGGHSRRVTELVEGILNQLQKSGPEVSLIVTAARLHDIGKISVPDSVLNKPGKLTEEEWAIMASHPEVGADFLGRHPGFKRGLDIVRHHHESWDGTGYPHKLKEREIPFGARVIAVADSFDAMTSDRPYRAGMTDEEAIATLRKGRAMQWDPEIVDAFVKSIEGRLEKPKTTALHLVHSDGMPLAQAV